MKKILYSSLIVIIIIFILSFNLKDNSVSDYYKDIFTSDEINFIQSNNINYDNLSKYLPYKSFNVYKYFEYEEKYQTCDNILEAINLVNDKDYYEPYNNTKLSFNNTTSLALVNKHFYLNSNYIPNDLVKVSTYNVDYIKRENEEMLLNNQCLISYLEMYNEAINDGIAFTIFSGYRSYERQEYLYYKVNKENDLYSARPGYSEHQTGLCLDLSTRQIGLTTNFKDSKEYKWLIDNSYKYGFILRYPALKKAYTLYEYEPWHFRYVGVSNALIIHNNNYCLEEYIIKYYEL